MPLLDRYLCFDNSDMKKQAKHSNHMSRSQDMTFQRKLSGIWSLSSSVASCISVISWKSQTEVSSIHCAYCSDTTFDVWLHFLADPDNSFRKSMVPNILTRVGEAASIPCLATDPSLVNLRLETCSSRALASGLQYSASLEQGIIIHNTQKAYEGCYVCTGMLREELVRSRDYNLIAKPGKAM